MESNTRQPSDAGESARQARLPKGPLLLMLALVIVFAWLTWLMQQSPPQPYPEVKPTRAVPADLQHPQDPRAKPAPGSGQRP